MTRSALLPMAAVIATFGCRGPTAQGRPLILAESDGEHLLHRPPPSALSNLNAPFIIKVDPKTAGSTDFFLMTEDIAPGQKISPHRHLHSEEIIFVHAGTGLATLGEREAVVETGATIYLPKNTVFTMRSTGTGPLRIVVIFSRPGFEEYMREISVPEGQVPQPLTLEELSAIRARHRSHAVYESP